MKATLLSLAGIVVGLVVFEVTMQPSTADRIELTFIFVFMAAASTATALLLPKAAKRSTRLAVTVFALLRLLSHADDMHTDLPWLVRDLLVGVAPTIGSATEAVDGGAGEGAGRDVMAELMERLRLFITCR